MDYIFCHNEALLYEYIEEYEPKLFKRIQELVKVGKWHIMGGWYVQPDCNVPSGEGFVRQIETGLKYFKEKVLSLTVGEIKQIVCGAHNVRKGIKEGDIVKIFDWEFEYEE